MKEASRKRVLIILSQTGSGGDSQVIYNLLLALDTRPFEFHILAAQRGNLYESFKGLGQIHTFPVDEMKLLRRALRRFSLPIYKNLKRRYGTYLIKKLNPDLVYINTVNEHEFSQAAVSFPCKTIVHIHEMGFVVTQRMRAEWILALLKKAHDIICPAKAVAEFYRNAYGIDTSRMHILQVVADNQFPIPQDSGDDLRSKLAIGPDIVLIGAVGSVIYRKGADLLIEACAILKKQLPHQPFVILWLGYDARAQQNHPYCQALQKSIAREKLAAYFQFLPPATNVGSFYAQLDMLVLPSRMEALPLVILEALLAAKPVVAMDVAGVREVIDSETGFLVKDQTPEGLAKGILYFIQNKELGLTTGQKGQQRVLENFEVKGQIRKWQNILENA